MVQALEVDVSDAVELYTRNVTAPLRHHHHPGQTEEHFLDAAQLSRQAEVWVDQEKYKSDRHSSVEEGE